MKSIYLTISISFLFSHIGYADNFKSELQILYNTHKKIADTQPKEMIAKWQAFIEKYPNNENVIEAQYLLSRIYAGSDGELGKKYLPYLESVIKNYNGNTQHVYYLYMLTTYAQVIATEGEREALFRQIMLARNKPLQYPIVSLEHRYHKAYRDSITLGAVWAELQEKTRKIKGMEARTQAALKVANELHTLKNGDVFYGLAHAWIRSDRSRFDQKNKNKMPTVVSIQPMPSTAPYTPKINAGSKHKKAKMILDKNDPGANFSPLKSYHKQTRPLLVNTCINSAQHKKTNYTFVAYLLLALGVFILLVVLILGLKKTTVK